MINFFRYHKKEKEIYYYFIKSFLIISLFKNISINTDIKYQATTKINFKTNKFKNILITINK